MERLPGYDDWKLSPPPEPDEYEPDYNCQIEGHCLCYTDGAPCCDCGAERGVEGA
jgi:hypothetical protein